MKSSSWIDEEMVDRARRAPRIVNEHAPQGLLDPRMGFGVGEQQPKDRQGPGCLHAALRAPSPPWEQGERGRPADEGIVMHRPAGMSPDQGGIARDHPPLNPREPIGNPRMIKRGGRVDHHRHAPVPPHVDQSIEYLESEHPLFVIGAGEKITQHLGCVVGSPLTDERGRGAMAEPMNGTTGHAGVRGPRAGAPSPPAGARKAGAAQQCVAQIRRVPGDR